jgi:DNA topoisomerase-1
LILSLYESRELEKHIAKLDAIEKDDGKAGLSPEEQIVMKILEAH